MSSKIVTFNENPKTKKNLTKLFLVSMIEEDFEMAKIAAQLGADVKDSIIDVIRKTDDIEFLKVVVEAGADPNYQNGAPMRTALLANKPNMIKALIALGARDGFKIRPIAIGSIPDVVFVLDTKINK